MTTAKHVLTWLTKPYYGSNRVSRLLRRIIEDRPIAELIGIPLASVMFMAAVIVPQTEAGFASAETYFDTQTVTIETLVTPSTFRWPFPTFGLSQGFFGGHPGLDLTNPAGTPVHPVAEGKVVLAANEFVGYGKHVIVEHDNALTSTYAHLSVIRVKTGDRVTKETELGAVGATGWATGNHLHLEVHQNGTALNPVEILPEAKKYEPREVSSIPSLPDPGLSL